MALIDFHCHLQHAGGYRSLRSAPDLFATSPTVVAVTNQPSDWRSLARRDTDAESVCWALGLHPEVRHPPRHLDQFAECASLSDAIGEVGLDFSRDSRVQHAEQRRLLEFVLTNPAARDRMITVHSRGATKELLRMLASLASPGVILHWFLGSEADIDAAVELDVYFSVNEHMTVTPSGQRVIALLPPNRVLLETDAPYGARGQSALPGRFDKTIRHLAKAWLRDRGATLDLVERNQRAFLGRLRHVPTQLARAAAG